MPKTGKRSKWINPQDMPYADRRVNQTQITAFKELPGFIRQEYQTEGRPSPHADTQVNDWADVEAAWEGLFGRALTAKELGELTGLSGAQLRRLKRFIYAHQHTKPKSKHEKVFVRFSLDEPPAHIEHTPSLLQGVARGQVLIVRLLEGANINLQQYRFYGFGDGRGNIAQAENYHAIVREISQDVKLSEETKRMYILGLMAKAALKYANTTRSKVISLVFVNKNNVQEVRQTKVAQKALETIQATTPLQHSMQHYTGRDGSRRTIQSIPTSLLRQQAIPVALLPELTRPGKRIKRLHRRLPELK